MPLNLKAPRKSPNFSIRGTYLGIFVDKSSGTHKRSVARARLRDIEAAIERGEYRKAAVQEAAGAPTFLTAAVAYLEARRRPRYVARLIRHFGENSRQGTPMSRGTTMYVWVETYLRIRAGKIQRVRGHWRRWPNSWLSTVAFLHTPRA